MEGQTSSSSDPTALSRAQFLARVAEREQRAAFRREHRIVVRDEVSGVISPIPPNGDSQGAQPPMASRIAIIAIPAAILLIIIIARRARRGATRA